MDIQYIKTLFSEKFGCEGIHYAAPGRINLIGEHTDYNGGFVFPGAVVQGIHAIIQPNGTHKVRAYAADLNSYGEFSIEDEKGPSEMHFRYVFGVAREMIAQGIAVEGFDTVFCGDVPLGAGMSSSAALESCFAFALNDMFWENRIDKMTLAKIGQATEHKYVGVNCGIMDQFASVHGRKNCLMRLDCQSGAFEYFPWEPKGYRLVLVNSCVKHELVGSPYNDRRRSCERVAAAIAKTKSGVETLRDCSWSDLERVRQEVGEEDYRRARYVLGEVDRVLAVSDALNRGDYETVGQQMYATHEGLSKDYEVSCEEIDFLVETAKNLAVTGCRIMGGGFGGCTINLVKDEHYAAFVQKIPSAYKAKFGIDCKIIDVEIGDGARRIE
ncbi:MAG: galactokinase [Bacteroidales bacterium]|nr:galactokinase [Bacteroidales bacterium]